MCCTVHFIVPDHVIYASREQDAYHTALYKGCCGLRYTPHPDGTAGGQAGTFLRFFKQLINRIEHGHTHVTFISKTFPYIR